MNAPRDPERDAIRMNWILDVTEAFKDGSDIRKLDAYHTIAQIWAHVESGSGTNAEALSRLTGLGFGNCIDEIKEMMDEKKGKPSSKELIDHFGLKIDPNRDWEEKK